MLLTCLARRKQSSSSKRLPPLRPSCVPPAEPASLDSGPPPIQTTTSAEARMSSSEENTMNDHMTVEGYDGAFAAYIARPKTSPASAVVVLQELFGVNADIHKTYNQLAPQRFLSVATHPFCPRA